MQYVTEAYREEMKLKWRGHCSVTAVINVLNLDARDSAHITSSYTGNDENIFDFGNSTGVKSTENDGHITITFEDFYELNIAGLYIRFVKKPSSITVTNGTKTETYAVNSNDFYVEDGYKNCHYLTITPNSGKLSFNWMQFGTAILFTDKQIISTMRNNEISHISSELPVKRFTLTVNNRELLFNKDNPYGYADYLQEKQVIKFTYGREMSDGSLYSIKGGKVLLRDWSSDDYEASFNCVGRLDFLDGKYYKGKVYPKGISAYNLAVQVLEDAGESHYRLDDALKKTQIFNPLPVCEHREALKMIANACRGVLSEDRDGNICIDSASRPSYIFTCQFTGAESYCIPSAIFDDNSAYNYADAEYDYATADGSLLFLPEDDTFRQVGFVSSQIANSNGLFTNNPSIHINFKSEYILKSMYLHFAVVVPTSITVTCKHLNTIVDTQTITTLNLTTVYEIEDTIDELTITFNSAVPNQRIHLNNIEMVGEIDYNLTYHELKSPPVANSLERVSKITVHAFSYDEEKTEEGSSHSSYAHIYRYENDDEGITTDIVTGENMYGSAISTIHATVGNNEAIFSAPYYNYKVTAGEIVESGAYYIVVKSDIEQDIDVYANPYTVTDKTFSIDVHEKGIEKESTNPLISSEIMANQQLTWLRDFYDDDIEYSLTYRGDPILDADDLIYLENHFVNENEIRITNETINTSMGMDFSCSLTARRTSYNTNSVVDEAIAGECYVDEAVVG